MPATTRGVFHNLKESKYTVSNSEIVFFFSSELYRNKFMDGYRQHRKEFKRKIAYAIRDTVYNFNTLADIHFYREVEKRGFRATIQGVDSDWEEIQRYALRKMTVPNTNGWLKIQKLK